MREVEKKAFVRAITVKLSRGEDFETIMESYTKLSEEDKQYFKETFGR